jgi:hypothetical protein
MYTEEPWQWQLINELEQIFHDFKAGVVAAELVDNRVPADRIFFRNQSTFKRPVANDIESVYWNDPEDQENFLVFELNREGIYDMLPEAVVHRQNRKSRDEDRHRMGQELRQQERDARKFFSPLENEFHHRGMRLDMTEREMIKNSNPRRNRQFFNYFFEDSSALSDEQVLILLHILPLSHKIRSDVGLISLTLSRILNYDIVVSQKWKRRTFHLPEDVARPLSGGHLGIDTVLNDHFHIATRYYEVRINGLSVEDYHLFTGSGKHLTVLNFMLPYCFPAGAEWSIATAVDAVTAPLHVSDDTHASFLGFNSYI